jgi:hypothetical protein
MRKNRVVGKRQIKSVRNTVLYLLMSMIFFITLFPIANAGGQDATFDSIDVTAVPSMQGVGGEINLEVKANFFGGCCYHLFAYDVKAELTAPENVQILSALPDTIKSVDAAPGGMATSKKFKWTLTSETPGTYTLEMKVSTSNCGSKSSTYQITFVEGASISEPTVFPSEPSINEPITFSALVRSGNELIEIERTTLFVWKNSKDYPRAELFADFEQLYYKKTDNNNIVLNTSDVDNASSTSFGELLGSGTPFNMLNVEYTDVWRVQFDEVDKEEFIYYWFNVETTDGKTITTEVFEQEIIDYEKKTQMLNSTIWSTLIIVIIGFILILALTWHYFDRATKRVNKPGIFILGSKVFSKPLVGEKINVEYTSPEKIRSILVIVFIIIMVILLLISIYLGLFQELISETGG